MGEIFLIGFYALFCRGWWWALKDWREDNRYPETHLDKPPRNPFHFQARLDAHMSTLHERDPSSW